jgi:hypothetical protein
MFYVKVSLTTQSRSKPFSPVENSTCFRTGGTRRGTESRVTENVREGFLSLKYFPVRRGSDTNKNCNFVRIFCIPATSCLPCTKRASVHGFSKVYLLARKKRKIYHVEQFHTNDGGGKSRSYQHNSAQLMKRLNNAIVLKANYVITSCLSYNTHNKSLNCESPLS